MAETKSFKRWTKREDIAIVIGAIVLGHNWKRIGQHINRSGGSCRLRYAYLVSHAKKVGKRTMACTARYQRAV